MTDTAQLTRQDKAIPYPAATATCPPASNADSGRGETQRGPATGKQPGNISPPRSLCVPRTSSRQIWIVVWVKSLVLQSLSKYIWTDQFYYVVLRCGNCYQMNFPSVTIKLYCIKKQNKKTQSRHFSSPNVSVTQHCPSSPSVYIFSLSLSLSLCVMLHMVS